MAQHTLTERLKIVEQSMTDVAPLPGRVDDLERRADVFEEQFLQFRAEVRVAFSAVRDEFSAVRAEMVALKKSTVDELGTQMRVLYEDLVERIKCLGQG